MAVIQYRTAGIEIDRLRTALSLSSGTATACAEHVILQSEIYNFHRLDLMRQVGFIVTVYDEDGLKLATTNPCSTPTEAFAEARKIVDNKIEGPTKNSQNVPSRMRVAAGAFGFLTLIQVFDVPER